MDHKDVIIQDLRADNKKLTEELEKLKSQPAAVDTDMERLTKRDKHGFAHYPYCFEKCDGDGIGIRCQTCDFEEKICNKLADYEDLDEQGLLLRLPCAIGSTIYQIAKVRSSHWEEDKIIIDDEGEWKVYKKTLHPVLIYDILTRLGKTIFLTEQEAQAALEKMKGE